MKNFYPKFIKRALDFALAGTLSVVLSPLILLICAIQIACGNGVFFAQPRPGKNGKIFPCYKFKTMNDARDAAGTLLPDEQRATRFGRFLRTTSLDELPQLLNILRGEMSIIGPRPLLPEYLPLYDATQRRRHDVLPGVTGWAQVNGRNALTWREKFELDVYYVDHISFALDFKIFLMTIVAVLLRRGINGGNAEVGTNAFNGKN